MKYLSGESFSFGWSRKYEENFENIFKKSIDKRSVQVYDADNETKLNKYKDVRHTEQTQNSHG